MKIALLIIITLSIIVSKSMAYDNCKPLKVAIVDTGLDLNDLRFSGHICPTGHVNLVENESLEDINGHGTFVAGLIEKYAGNSSYCFVIYKYFSDKNSNSENLVNEIKAFKEATQNGADIINFSGGGEGFSEDEFIQIKDNPRTLFVVAAGNENKNIDFEQNRYYPASYFLNNEIVVGSVDSEGIKAPSSNWSEKITIKENGINVQSYVPYRLNSNGYGYMSGTSMSTAIYTGKIVAKYQKSCHTR